MKGILQQRKRQDTQRRIPQPKRSLYLDAFLAKGGGKEVVSKPPEIPYGGEKRPSSREKGNRRKVFPKLLWVMGRLRLRGF